MDGSDRIQIVISIQNRLKGISNNSHSSIINARNYIILLIIDRYIKSNK